VPFRNRPEQSLSLTHNQTSPLHLYSSFSAPQLDNPIWSYFVDHKRGPGLHKWHGYFDVYHRHLQHMRGTGRPVRVLEIGVQSGGR
jgi:hypothetical protein